MKREIHEEVVDLPSVTFTVLLTEISDEGSKDTHDSLMLLCIFQYNIISRNSSRSPGADGRDCLDRQVLDGLLEEFQRRCHGVRVNSKTGKICSRIALDDERLLKAGGRSRSGQPVLILKTSIHSHRVPDMQCLGTIIT